MTVALLHELQDKILMILRSNRRRDFESISKRIARWVYERDQEQSTAWQRTITQRLCAVLQVPYGSEDGHGVRCYTLDEVVSHIEARSDMWRTLLARIEEVDPEWLDALRRGPHQEQEQEQSHGG